MRERGGSKFKSISYLPTPCPSHRLRQRQCAHRRKEEECAETMHTTPAGLASHSPLCMGVGREWGCWPVHISGVGHSFSSPHTSRRWMLFALHQTRQAALTLNGERKEEEGDRRMDVSSYSSARSGRFMGSYEIWHPLRRQRRRCW